MKEEYLNIFNVCFPQFLMTYERFCSLFQEGEFYYFEHAEAGETVGFGIVKDFAIQLLCVIPEKQQKGIGSKLLIEMEQHIKQKGYEKIIIGGVSSSLFIGAVSDRWSFFENRGYEANGSYDEMLLNLNEFELEKCDLKGSKVAKYGWYKGDSRDICDAVAKVDESWVQYFINSNNIYAAQVDGEIASFCLVDQNCNNYLTDMYGRIGMPGCVGTVPKYRNKGIALEMVARATKYLKDEGMDISFIYYTGVADWYKKIGYNIFLTEIFCEKRIS